MTFQRARLIYFSPTHTTRRILEAIAEGIQTAELEQVDLTHPVQALVEARGELAIIGSPVYGGRLPQEMIFRLRQLNGNGTPTVIVVVYGNRAYEDALLELRDLACEIGFRPVAAGAFIGEHSYSTRATPIAAGRPDQDDLIMAKEFGKSVCEKLTGLQFADHTPPLRVPGNFPYKDRVLLTDISPVTEEKMCDRCGLCAPACPTAAISISDTVRTDEKLCIRCCACVKVCPNAARSMLDDRIKRVAETLSINYRQRKEPELYL